VTSSAFAKEAHMPKQKYSNEEKIEFYKNKIQQLEEEKKLLTPIEIDNILREILVRIDNIELNLRMKKPN